MGILDRRRFIIQGFICLCTALASSRSSAFHPNLLSEDGIDLRMKRAGFTRYRNPNQKSHLRVYTVGSGPAVLLLHELPGPYKEDLEAACRIAQSGFTAVVPIFFGVPGEDHTSRYFFLECMVPTSQFHCWLPGITSRAAHSVAELVPDLYQSYGGKGVGVIGMCLTGTIPLYLLGVPQVKAAVLCEPTNPFPFKSRLDLAKSDLQTAARRKEVTVLAIKFSGDGKSPAKRFKMLRRLLAGHYSEIIIQDGPEQCVLKNAPHSVFGGDYEQGSGPCEAFNRAIRYLDERLSLVQTKESYPKAGEICPNFLSCFSDIKS